MATVLEKPLKREVSVDGKTYMLTITPDGVKITEKGRRIGREMTWRDLLSGDAALASQLLQSVSTIAPKHEGKDEPAKRSATSKSRSAPPTAR